MSSVTLISITGEDQPGLTGSLMSLMAEHGIQVLDIGQAVIHRSLALGLLVSVPTGSGILKELLFHVHELNLQASFTDISSDDYERWVNAHGQPRYIVTLLARAITAEHIARIGSVTNKFDLNIEDIKRLSGRLSLTSQTRQDKACIEFSVRGTVADLVAVRQEFLVLASELDVDISFQEDTVFRRNRRLVCFDMDSTLIEGEVIDELAVLAGVGEQVSAITERAMRGELDFTESLRQRVALLEGLPESCLYEVYDRLPITEGADRLIGNLKRVGYRTAILSGGFTFFGHYLQQKLGIDYVHANELALKDGKLTGQVTGQVVDGARKASLMAEIAEREHISLEQVIAVGDGANDLPMLSAAGLGIAFRAKPIVQQKAEHAISNLGLDGILYLLGFSDAQ